ncbi:diguanylate cyclase [Sphingomonas jatrophae]|uniref:diguanylate cyclase n=2 Tax=Sphingomonas jatrophae TaxID=1166337 RepID=A0A1I6LRM2_9SPHN|nr:diguanylate cyclase [Sphingomonas jatrophae]
MSADRDIYYRAGVLLFDHDLRPSPGNYALAHAYVERDPRIVAAVDAALAGGAGLTQQDADTIMAIPDTGGSAPVSPAALAQMIGEAQARFDSFSGLVDSSRDDAARFGDALEQGAAGIAAADALDLEAVAALLDITRTMIDTTRQAEERLRATGAEMAELRASLAAARADAETDPLTALPNRRAFAARFAEARETAIAEARPLAVALIDIDRFKAVNDVHGHEVGDRVIQLVGKELLRGCTGHLVGRHGGEEFIILFDGTPLPAARALLDATRADLAGRTLKVAGTGRELGTLTFSAGLVALKGAESCAAAIRRADTLLYRAKQAGRNRIEA